VTGSSTDRSIRSNELRLAAREAHCLRLHSPLVKPCAARVRAHNRDAIAVREEICVALIKTAAGSDAWIRCGASGRLRDGTFVAIPRTIEAFEGDYNSLTVRVFVAPTTNWPMLDGRDHSEPNFLEWTFVPSFRGDRHTSAPTL
jgi:hypothetical protein